MLVGGAAALCLDLITTRSMAAGLVYVVLAVVLGQNTHPRAGLFGGVVATLLGLLGFFLPIREPWTTADLIQRLGDLVMVWVAAGVLHARSRAGRAAQIERQARQRILDVAETIFVVLDAEGRVTEINRKGCEILHLEPDRAIGLDWIDNFVPEPERPGTREVFQRLVAGRIDPMSFYENNVLTARGDLRKISWHNMVLQDADGNALGTLSSGIDVTELDVVGKRLRQYSKELADTKRALDQAAIVAIADRHGHFQYVNEKFCEISGYERAELLGKEHSIVSAEFRPGSARQALLETVGAGRAWRGQLETRRKDGSVYWVDTTVVPFLDEGERPVQFVVIQFDITEYRRAEEELRKSAALAQLGEMAAVVAHEVKNPLTGIMGALQVISGRMAPNTTERRVIGDIQDRLRALNATIQDLLVYARPKAPERVPVRLVTALQSVARSVADDPAYEHVTLAITGADVMVHMDPNLLREAVLNLFLNSAQAMNGEGEIHVDVSTDGERSFVSFSDTGPGIADETIERIFEPFFTTKTRGTGLGLAVVKRIVEIHGGEVAVVCPPGGGTRIGVVLPALEQDAAHAEAPPL